MATKTRKFLDRERTIPLNGTPVAPDWFLLLTLGKGAVLSGAAEMTPFLDEVMWQGVSPHDVQSPPASLNNHLMRRWVEIETRDAAEFLREQ